MTDNYIVWHLQRAQQRPEMGLGPYPLVERSERQVAFGRLRRAHADARSRARFSRVTIG
jgi:hypothetical protein